MLTHDQLVELYRECRGDKVLSVYLDVEQHDPAERNRWKVLLDQGLGRVRKEVDEDHAERSALEAAWGHIQKALGDAEAFVPERGWAGFATAERVLHAGHVPVPMSDGVYWEDGLRVAPYVRGLKQERPVAVLLVDSHRARIFRYQEGAVSELIDERADTFLGDMNDVNMSKRASTHSGVRGATSTDQAQRALDVGADRMVKHLVEQVTPIMGDHGFLVLGGVSEMVARAAHAFPKALQPRMVEPSTLHLEMSTAEVKRAAEEAASLLTRRHQEELLAQVVDAARAGARGCLGPEETVQALEEMRVETLLLSRSFLRASSDLADRCVGSAFAQGAHVEELSDPGGAELDREGEGIGARLRYRLPQGEGGEN